MNEAKYTVPRTRKTPEEKHLAMLDKVRQQASAPAQRPSSQWMSHVKETRAQSGKSMKEAMILAKMSYRAKGVES